MIDQNQLENEILIDTIRNQARNREYINQNLIYYIESVKKDVVLKKRDSHM